MIKPTLITKHYYISKALIISCLFPWTTQRKGITFPMYFSYIPLKVHLRLYFLATKRAKSSIAFLREQALALYVYQMYCVLGVLIRRKRACKDELYCYSSRVRNYEQLGYSFRTVSN